MTAFEKIRKTYQTYVGDLRLILADEDLHLNDLTRHSLENDVQIAQMNMNSLAKKEAKDPEKFEQIFRDVVAYGDEVILSFALTVDPYNVRSTDRHEEIR